MCLAVNPMSMKSIIPARAWGTTTSLDTTEIKVASGTALRLLCGRERLGATASRNSDGAGINPWRELTLPGRIPRFRERGDGSIENMSKHSDRSPGFLISRGANT